MPLSNPEDPGALLNEMSIDSIRVSPENFQRVLILKEKGTNRYLPIWIGPAEADAIAITLQDLRVPRPLGYDFFLAALHALDSSLDHCVVDGLRDNVFYAKTYLRTDEGLKEVDCRPSDACALSVRTGTPIYVKESVMAEAGLMW